MTALRRVLAVLLRPPRALIDRPTLAELRVTYCHEDGTAVTRALFSEYLPIPAPQKEQMALDCLDEALNLFQNTYRISRRRLLLQLGQLTRGQ